MKAKGDQAYENTVLFCNKDVLDHSNSVCLSHSGPGRHVPQDFKLAWNADGREAPKMEDWRVVLCFAYNQVVELEFGLSLIHI